MDEARELERILILTYESWKPENGYNRVKPKEYPDLMHYSVYQLIFPDDHKMYVGYTGGSLEARWANGYGYRDNPELFEAINRVGWENVIKIRCVENILEESAMAFEAYLIVVNHTTDPARGYNKSKSGDREHGGNARRNPWSTSVQRTEGSGEQRSKRNSTKDARRRSPALYGAKRHRHGIPPCGKLPGSSGSQRRHLHDGSTPEKRNAGDTISGCSEMKKRKIQTIISIFEKSADVTSDIRGFFIG